ncbi:hypothetical protein DRP04_05635 [Archaeoglobales archaeon]|nr:MAG: hypothetical protein DRP04_05635 [Archaeoglobales archaeon]
MSKNNEIAIHIRHVDREAWELAKAFLKSEYGTHYAHLGDFISFCIKYTLEHAFGVKDSTSLNAVSLSKFDLNIKSRRRKEAIIKICNELSEFPEDFYSPKTIKNVIVRTLSNGSVPSHQTIYNYLNFFVANGALINVRGSYKLKPDKLKEIMKKISDEIR